MEATRIAIVQVAPAFLDRAECLRIAVRAVAEAAAGGARLIVFPEAFIPGYPAWIWRLRPGGDMALSERLHRALLENAVDLTNEDLTSLREAARKLAADPELPRRREEKRTALERDERCKPLARYREEELERMRLNFYGFDPSYHVARYHFVYRVARAWTPLHLALHRRDQWRRQTLLRQRVA